MLFNRQTEDHLAEEQVRNIFLSNDQLRVFVHVRHPPRDRLLQQLNRF